MHYYPYPFKSSGEARLHEEHEADGHIDRLICALVGLLSLTLLSSIVWP